MPLASSNFIFVSNKIKLINPIPVNDKLTMELYEKSNMPLKTYFETDNEHLEFLNTLKNRSNYFDNQKSYYPNKKGYYEITKKIISKTLEIY